MPVLDDYLRTIEDIMKKQVTAIDAHKEANAVVVAMAGDDKCFSEIIYR